MGLRLVLAVLRVVLVVVFSVALLAAAASAVLVALTWTVFRLLSKAGPERWA